MVSAGDGRGQRQHDQGQIQGAAREFPYEVVGAALLDEELDARVPVVERAQDLGQQTGADARGRAEPDPAAAQLRQLLHLDPRGVGVREDPAGQRKQRLARVGQRDVAARPAEQLRAQLLLQGPDLLGERGLGDVHLLGGPGEVPGLGDRHEVVRAAGIAYGNDTPIDRHGAIEMSRTISWTDRDLRPVASCPWLWQRGRTDGRP